MVRKWGTLSGVGMSGVGGRLPILSLEEQSFRNLVHFYREELRAIMGGATTKEFFRGSLIANLRKRGILSTTYYGAPRGARTLVTPRAQALLA